MFLRLGLPSTASRIRISSSSRYPRRLGEANEFSGSGNDGAALRRARHGDSAAAPELEKTFVSKLPKRPQDGIGVHAEHRGEVARGREALAGLRLAIALVLGIATYLVLSWVNDTTPLGSSRSAEQPAPGAGERLSLYTHCGVVSAFVDGRLWLADPPRQRGYDDPLTGWDFNDTQGTWRDLGNGRATFRADSGATASFVRARPGQPDPNAGCE